MRVFIAESVSAGDFYNRNWDGNVARESLRINKEIGYYRIVMTVGLLRRAVKEADRRKCDIFHFSCHGNSKGVYLTNCERLSWGDLAQAFQRFASPKRMLILSSCIGGDVGAARAFKRQKAKFGWILGPEADTKETLLTFSGACIAWPILYTELSAGGIKPKVLRIAIKKMNKTTVHRFVYRRLDPDKKEYRRYPSRPRW